MVLTDDAERPHDARSDGAEGHESPEDDEVVWKALAHRLRRGLLDELRDGPLPTGELAGRFTVSRHVVMQHLQVLREADLVRTERHGRVRLNYLNPVPIQRIHRRWVSQYEGVWAEALLGLRAQVEEGGQTDGEEDRDVG